MIPISQQDYHQSYVYQGLVKTARLNLQPEDSFIVKSAKLASGTVSKLALASFALLAVCFYGISTAATLPLSYCNQKPYLALKTHTVVSARACFDALSAVAHPYRAIHLLKKNPPVVIETSLTGRLGALIFNHAHNISAVAVLGLSLYFFEQRELTLDHIKEYFGFHAALLALDIINHEGDLRRVGSNLLRMYGCAVSSHYFGLPGLIGTGALFTYLYGFVPAIRTIRIQKQAFILPELIPQSKYGIINGIRFFLYTMPYHMIVFAVKEGIIGIGQSIITNNIRKLGARLYLSGSKRKGSPYSLLYEQKLMVRLYQMQQERLKAQQQQKARNIKAALPQQPIAQGAKA